MNVLTHAPVDGAGRHITLIQSAPHPTSHAPLPNVLSPLTTSTWGQYAPPHSSLVMTHMSLVSRQEITTVTWKVFTPTSHVEVPL